MAEDCLFLSITAPLLSSENSSRNGSDGYPVVVYFHGGGFISGSGANYPGSDTSTFSRNGIIGVVPNYRLNIFGSFATPKDRGNLGLGDQIVALKWVQQNIAAFGGDPKKVTIMGSSAGGQSVYAHLASPASHGLYSAAIIGSGPLGYLYPTIEAAMNVTAAVFNASGCGVDDITCMRNRTYEEILRAQQHLPESMLMKLSYMPHIDPGSEILPVQPFNAIKNGHYPHVPLLVSFNRDEAMAFIQATITYNITSKMYPYIVYGFAENFMYVDDTLETSYTLEGMYPYTNDTSDGRYPLSNMVTDALVACPTIHALRSATYCNKPPIYVYMFDHIYSDSLKSPVQWERKSVPHCSDYACVFDANDDRFAADGLPGQWNGTVAERKMCHNLNSAFSNFIQNGDPNIGRPLDPSMKMTAFNASGKIMILDMEIEVGNYPRSQLCDHYWDIVQPVPDPTLLLMDLNATYHR